MQQKMFTSRINVFFFSTQCTLTALFFSGDSCTLELLALKLIMLNTILKNCIQI